MSLFFLLPAHAGVYATVSQFTNDSSVALTGGSTHPYGQSFTAGTTGVLTSMVVPLYLTSGANVNCQMQIARPLGVANDASSNSVNVDGTAQTTIADWRQFTFSGANAVVVTSGVQYWLTLACGPDASAARVTTYGSASDKIVGSFGTSTNRGTTINPALPITDLAFAIYVETDGSTNNSLNFNGTPSTTPDFSSWATIGYASAASTTAAANWDRSIEYSGDPTFATYIIDARGYFLGAAGPFGDYIPEVDVPKSVPIPVNSTIFARAVLCSVKVDDGPGSLGCPTANRIYTSAIWTFVTTDNNGIVLNSQSPEVGITATSTDNAANFTCDSSDGFFQTSLCKLFQVIFVPSQDSLLQFTELKNQVQNKPPFGYLTVYQNSIGSLASASSTTSTIATSSFNFTTSITTLMGSSPLLNIQTALGYLIWLYWGFGVYKRFKDFSLIG